MRTILLLLTLMVAGCLQSAAPVVSSEPGEDELGVVISLLSDEYNNCVKNNVPIIIEDTFSIAMLHMGDESHEKLTKSLLADASDQIPADLIRDFCAKNAKPQSVWPELTKRLPVVLFSKADMNALFSEHPSSKPAGWDGFYVKYPKSPGIITLSRVGFNRQGDMAMIYVGSQSHWLAGGGRIRILRKQGAKWIEVPAMIGPQWVS